MLLMRATAAVLMAAMIGSGDLALAQSSNQTAPSRYGYTPGPAAAPATGPSLALGKCINLSNTLEAPNEGGWGPAVARADFQAIKSAGFTSVRIPVRWSGHAAETAPYAIDPVFLQRVHEVVDMATDEDLGVILNMQHYEALFATPDAHGERFAQMWDQIGASFARAPNSVWFELINEPHDKLDDDNLLRVLTPALAAVRATNARRPVLIGGRDWSSLDSLATLPLPDDPFVVPTFHYYEPYAFTHQGATWVNPSPPVGRPFGGPDDAARLKRDLAKVQAYMTGTGRVPIVGEYGASDVAGVPTADRIAFYGTISAAFASVGLQSCAWGYRSGFRLRDRNGWLPGLVEAISTTQTSEASKR